MSQKLIVGLGILLGINILYVLSGVLNFPIESVDVLGIWLFKAKAIFVEGGLPLQTLKDPDFLLAHPQYPLLLSAFYGGIYILFGQVWELPILLLYPLYYLAILYLVYQVLRELTLPKPQALAYVYLYSMFSPLLGQAGRGHAGSADIVIVLLAWLVVRLLQTQASRFPWQTLGLVVAVVWIASQVKLEGLFLAAAIIWIRSTRPAKVTALLLTIIPLLLWNITLAYYRVPSDFTFVFPGIGGLLARAWLTLGLSLQEMGNFRNWYFFWPVAGLALVTARPVRHIFIQQLVLILGSISLGYLAVYLTVTTDVSAHISSSIDRVLLHLTPWLYPVFVWYSQKHLTDATRSLVRAGH